MRTSSWRWTLKSGSWNSSLQVVSNGRHLNAVAFYWALMKTSSAIQFRASESPWLQMKFNTSSDI
eukprot:5914121-Lingulodinium_polyedra.AAC.1